MKRLFKAKVTYDLVICEYSTDEARNVALGLSPNKSHIEIDEIQSMKEEELLNGWTLSDSPFGCNPDRLSIREIFQEYTLEKLAETERDLSSVKWLLDNALAESIELRKAAGQARQCQKNYDDLLKKFEETESLLSESRQENAKRTSELLEQN